MASASQDSSRKNAGTHSRNEDQNQHETGLAKIKSYVGGEERDLTRVPFQEQESQRDQLAQNTTGPNGLHGEGHTGHFGRMLACLNWPVNKLVASIQWSVGTGAVCPAAEHRRRSSVSRSVRSPTEFRVQAATSENQVRVLLERAPQFAV